MSLRNTQHFGSHLRRNFINAAAGRDDLDDWSEQCLDRIGHLYQLNYGRLETGIEELFSAADSEFAAASGESVKHEFT